MEELVMSRSLASLGLSVILAVPAIGGEPVRKARPDAPSGSAPSLSSAARKDFECLLQTPSRLDFGDRKRVTVGEVLERIREQHHLSMRFDMPTVALLLGPGGAGRYAIPSTTQSFSCKPPAAESVIIGNLLPLPAAGAIVATAFDSESQPQPLPVPRVAVAPPAADGSSLPPAAAAQAAPLAEPVAPVVSLPQVDPSVFPARLVPPAVQPQCCSPGGTGQNSADSMAELLAAEIDLESLDLSRASVATVLRHALDAVPTMSAGDFGGMPILYTNAMLLDYVIEDHGLLITTRMQALTTKETRVYSIKHLRELPAEQLARTIKQAIRPWSWRSQINELGDQLKGTPLPTDTLTSILKTGMQLVAAETEINFTPAVPAESQPAKATSSTDEALQLAMLGNAIANGLVTVAQATLSAAEIIHYAEPPTGSIQVLGSRLIITQSQAAHREIADLLAQLAEE
jgi:hypothetical protein